MPSQNFAMPPRWIPRLSKSFGKLARKRKTDIQEITGSFLADPTRLVHTYIEPDCQKGMPGSSTEGNQREPIFTCLEKFISSNRSQGASMFLLAESGMGKTSLLIMLKLAHLGGLWPRDFDCILRKVNDVNFEDLKRIENPGRKVLLLDGLDQDLPAWESLEARIHHIMEITRSFNRVIITADWKIFSKAKVPLDDETLVLGRVSCPVFYISPFSDSLVNRFLERQYPKSWKERLFGGSDTRQVQAKAIVSKMMAFRRRPLLLAHLDRILSSSHAVEDEYSAFYALVDAWLQGEIEQRQQDATPIEQLWTTSRILASLCYFLGDGRVLEEKITGFSQEFRDGVSPDFGFV